MNNYLIELGQDKITAKGFSLSNALNKLGLIGDIIPLWYRKSNGRYKILNNPQHSIILITWIK